MKGLPLCESSHHHQWRIAFPIVSMCWSAYICVTKTIKQTTPPFCMNFTQSLITSMWELHIYTAMHERGEGEKSHDKLWTIDIKNILCNLMQHNIMKSPEVQKVIDVIHKKFGDILHFPYFSSWCYIWINYQVLI